MELDPIQEASRAQFAKQSHHYGAGHILENVEDVAAAAPFLKLPERAKVLDIAAANGHTGLFFAAAGHEVILSDLAEPMLERAKENAAKRGLKIETALHAAEELPYPEATFDLVTCRVAAHHFSSPDRFIRESARVLKPGGAFLLIDGSVPDHEPVAEEWIHRVEKARDPSHGRFITPEGWSRLCAAAGLEVDLLQMVPMKQPDLEWYFEAAATSPENREAVRRFIAEAPDEARRVFQLGQEEGKTVWWWPRLTLVAHKAAAVH